MRLRGRKCAILVGIGTAAALCWSAVAVKDQIERARQPLLYALEHAPREEANLETAARTALRNAEEHGLDLGAVLATNGFQEERCTMVVQRCFSLQLGFLDYRAVSVVLQPRELAATATRTRASWQVFEVYAYVYRD